MEKKYLVRYLPNPLSTSVYVTSVARSSGKYIRRLQVLAPTLPYLICFASDIHHLFFFCLLLKLILKCEWNSFLIFLVTFNVCTLGALFHFGIFILLIDFHGLMISCSIALIHDWFNWRYVSSLVQIFPKFFFCYIYKIQEIRSKNSIILSLQYVKKSTDTS